MASFETRTRGFRAGLANVALEQITRQSSTLGQAVSTFAVKTDADHDMDDERDLEGTDVDVTGNDHNQDDSIHVNQGAVLESPFKLASCTRVEENPWWEVEWAEDRRVSSVVLIVATPPHKTVLVS